MRFCPVVTNLAVFSCKYKMVIHTNSTNTQKYNIPLSIFTILRFDFIYKMMRYDRSINFHRVICSNYSSCTPAIWVRRLRVLKKDFH